jgi:hypothetical protein
VIVFLCGVVILDTELLARELSGIVREKETVAVLENN